MERLRLDRHAMTGEMFALEDVVPDGLEFIGFDPRPPGEIDPAALDEDVPAAVAIPLKPVRRRHAKTPTRPHLVPLWLDAGELLKITGGAEAAGLALPDYLRARALKDPKVHARPAERGPDLFLPAALPPTGPVPLGAELPADLEERIDAYYASDERSNAIFYGRAAGDLQPNRLSRLGHVLTELFGMLPLSHRALPREGT